MTTRLVGFSCLFLLASGLVFADVALVCHEQTACDRTVDTMSSHCKDAASIVSSWCLDTGESGKIGVRPARSPSQNDNRVVEAENVASERVPAPSTTLDSNASVPLATPSPPLYRIHAALLL